MISFKVIRAWMRSALEESNILGKKEEGTCEKERERSEERKDRSRGEGSAWWECRGPEVQTADICQGKHRRGDEETATETCLKSRLKGQCYLQEFKLFLIWQEMYPWYQWCYNSVIFQQSAFSVTSQLGKEKCTEVPPGGKFGTGKGTSNRICKKYIYTYIFFQHRVHSLFCNNKYCIKSRAISLMGV